MKSLLYFLIPLFSLLTSCKAPENIVYLQNLKNSQMVNTSANEILKIVSGDRLSIIVSSKDMELADVFNNAAPLRHIGTNSLQSANARISTYFVDQNGDIDFPILGQIHVVGLTKHELARLIKDKIIAADYVLDPVVTVEFGNCEVSILGEVKTPGCYKISKERNTIFDALAQAMDLTINGQRTDILVIRENQFGHSTCYRIDLTDSKVMESPVYYLQQNDLIYVSPNDQRKRESKTFRNTFQKPAFWLSVTSTLCSVILLLRKVL